MDFYFIEEFYGESPSDWITLISILALLVSVCALIVADKSLENAKKTTEIQHSSSLQDNFRFQANLLSDKYHERKTHADKLIWFIGFSENLIELESYLKDRITNKGLLEDIMKDYFMHLPKSLRRPDETTIRMHYSIHFKKDESDPVSKAKADELSEKIISIYRTYGKYDENKED